MNLRCVWRPADHFLLKNVTAEVQQDDVAVPTRVMAGQVEAEVDEHASSLRLVLVFKARVGGDPPAEVLRIDQTWKQPPVGFGLQPVFTPASFTILSGTNRRRRIIPGLHPLLRGRLIHGEWPTLTALVSLVDVTGLLPLIPTMNDMAPRANGERLASTPRILARTDGVLPQLWIVSTPDSCAGSEATDVLCFLGPSQNHGAPPTLEKQLADPATSGALLRHAAVMLGTGKHNGPLVKYDESLNDHFSPTNIILAKGLEKAVALSDKNAILAVPVPANYSHNQAATAALPGLLADVHRVIHAVGDAHPKLKDQNGEEVEHEIAEPRYALAAHSRGALAIYGEPDPGHSGPRAPSRRRPGALAAGPKTYSDVILFEPLDVSTHTDALRRTENTIVSFVGFDYSTTIAPFNSLKSKLAGRIHRFPVTPPRPPQAVPNLDTLKARSASLAHALSTIPPIPNTEVNRMRIREILHQVCTWSGDGGVWGATEEHFLTQALKVSGLR